MQHIEQRFSGSNMVRGVVIGMAAGLTVPFALAAGMAAFCASQSAPPAQARNVFWFFVPSPTVEQPSP